ncbi:FkbM family methyltransferase [Paraburkholderia sp. GAS82]|uniref:FkbM family methyltransferase n=1 Tax=Paraburkholderia sp. GAS82 TaxID=3035137 RepID=UPI003D1FEC77
MTLVSFAQNQEDILLWRALQQVSNGFYIDVGAADPSDLSITKLFYDHGWHGINLEPQGEYFASLSDARPHDINLRIAAGREAASLTFHRIDGSGLSTFDNEIAAKHRADGWAVVEEAIEVLPLAEICRRYRPHGPIHFLKVDVEGSEGDVLAGADFSQFRPWIVLVEATLPLSQKESWADWEPILTSQGYSFVWFDGLNRFYLAHEMKKELAKHFLTPPNTFDGFEPAVSLLQRAERAEHALNQTREQATETIRKADAASRRAVAVMERIAEASTEAVIQSARAAEEAGRQAVSTQRTMQQEMQQLARALTQTIQRSDAALAEQSRRSDEVQRIAVQAQERLAQVLNSSSWRVTAPLRASRRLVSGGPRAVLRRLKVKELARRFFLMAARAFLWLPGGRRSMRLVHSIAPRPSEWVAARYRAYEQGAQERRAGSPAHPAASAGNVLLAGQSVDLSQPRLDDALSQFATVLSEEELRLCRHFIVGRSANDTTD